jgi:hypothetical protein
MRIERLAEIALRSLKGEIQSSVRNLDEDSIPTRAW